MSLFIHTGYAKAGSTFLQERLFAPHPGIHYLGKSRTDYPDWLIGWHYWDDFEFERQRDELSAKLDSLCQTSRPNLISSEVFSKHGGGAAAQAHRIKAIAPAASIILVLRDPIDRLLSYYKHLVQHDGLYLPLEECLDWKRTPFVFYKRKPVYLPDYFYDELVALYEQLFDGRVIVLRFEELLTAPGSFCGKLGEFISVRFDVEEIAAQLENRENASVAEGEIARLRLKNAAAGLRKLAPDYTEQPTDLAAPIGDSDLLSAAVRQRLVTYLHGRCQGYY
ncbi:MAG: sulfotransferase [bacterium]